MNKKCLKIIMFFAFSANVFFSAVGADAGDGAPTTPGTPMRGAKCNVFGAHSHPKSFEKGSAHRGDSPLNLVQALAHEREYLRPHPFGANTCTWARVLAPTAI